MFSPKLPKINSAKGPSPDRNSTSNTDYKASTPRQSVIEESRKILRSQPLAPIIRPSSAPITRQLLPILQLPPLTLSNVQNVQTTNNNNLNLVEPSSSVDEKLPNKPDSELPMLTKVPSPTLEAVKPIINQTSIMPKPVADAKHILERTRLVSKSRARPSMKVNKPLRNLKTHNSESDIDAIIPSISSRRI